MKLVSFDEKYKTRCRDWHKRKDIADNIGLWNKEYTDNDLNVMIEDWLRDKKTKIFGIEKDFKPMGYVMIRNIDETNKSGEIHISVCEKTCNGILAYNAYKKILEYAFEILGLNRVYTFCLENRIDLIGIMMREPFGFKSEGILRKAVCKDNEYLNIYIYGLLKNEFRRKKQCQPQ